MPLVVKDRVRETSTSTGTGDIILNGAVAGFQSFAEIGNANTTYYTIVDATTGQFEVGIGTYTLATTTLSRDTVLESSAGGAAVNFAANVKDVFVTYPAERSVYVDGGTITPAVAAILPVVSGGTGAATLTGFVKGTGTSALTGQATIPSTDITGLGTMSIQNANSVAVTGGTINNASIGASTASTVASTNLSYTGTLTGGTGVINIGSGQVVKDANGNVGIGTSSPTAPLQVARSFADSAIEEIARFSRTGAAFSSNNRAAAISFSDANNQTLTAAIAGIRQNSNSDFNGALGFYTNNTGGNSATSVSQLTERLRITASGNVGIGTNNPGARLEVSSTATSGRILLNAADLPMITNGFDKFTSGAFNGAGRFGMFMEVSQLTLGCPPTGAFTFKTFNADSTSSERARITASGNVGIGTSSPGAKLEVNGQILSGGAGTSQISYSFGGQAAKTGIGCPADGTIAFYAGVSTERARIDSSGNLLVGTTSTTFSTNNFGIKLAPNGECNFVVDTAPNILAFSRNNNGDIAKFFSGGNQVGAISVTSSATTFATSSDYRLKHDIAPMTGALARVALLKPCTYKWNVDDSIDEGFIAHELAEVCPSAVSGEKDAVNEDGSINPQGIDTSFLVATLTAAIQELKAINDAQAQTIESLTARISALESN